MHEINPTPHSVTKTLEEAGIDVLADTGIDFPDELRPYEVEPVDVLALIHLARNTYEPGASLKCRVTIREAINGLTQYNYSGNSIASNDAQLINACEKLADYIVRNETNWGGFFDDDPPPPPTGWPGWTITTPDEAVESPQ